MPSRPASEAALRYRCATADDAPAIADLHAASWRATYRGALRDDYLDVDVQAERRGVWNERLGRPAANQYVVVATDGERVVGFACAYGGDDAQWGTQLDNIHVDRAIQGRGLGTRLVADVAAWCRIAYPDAGLYLWVLEQNHAARRFYERLGATDEEGDVWLPPDGSAVKTRRYVWSSDGIIALERNRGAA